MATLPFEFVSSLLLCDIRTIFKVLLLPPHIEYLRRFFVGESNELNELIIDESLVFVSVDAEVWMLVRDNSDELELLLLTMLAPMLKPPTLSKATFKDNVEERFM